MNIPNWRLRIKAHIRRFLARNGVLGPLKEIKVQSQDGFIATIEELGEEAGLGMAFIYTCPEFGLSAEWSIPDWEISLQIEPAGSVIQCHATHLPSEEWKEATISLERPGIKDAIRAFLLQFQGLAERRE